MVRFLLVGAVFGIGLTAAGSPEALLRDGFTVRFAVDCGEVRTDEPLYAWGPMKFGIRMAGRDPALAEYDAKWGNYLNFPLADGSCPVLEAVICEKAGRIGIPLGCLPNPSGTHAVTLQYAPPHWMICVDGKHFDEDMPVKEFPVVWSGADEKKILSARVTAESFVAPADPTAIPLAPVARPITGPIQYWTPSGHDAWVGDVTVANWEGRLHLFYLFDRRHHRSGAWSGRHYFAHLSTDDLTDWVEHPAAVPITEWYESIGTGTPFRWGSRFCLSFGHHSTRIAKNGEPVPVGGSYALSDDGIHFRKSGEIICVDENPSVYNRADGKLGMVTREPGAMFVSTDGSPRGWKRFGATTPCGGDCPSAFSWNGWEYLIQGFCYMGARPDKGDDEPWQDWTKSGDDIYDGLGVPMVTAWQGNRRLYAGWLGSAHGWAGWLVLRELIQYPDGKLGMKWPDEVRFPVQPSVWSVTDVDHPFVRRFDSENGDYAVEFRIDPKLRRAQFAFPRKGEKGGWVSTVSELYHRHFPEGPELEKRRIPPTDMIPGEGRPFAVAKIRGLDRPFTVRFVQYYDPKADQTIFDAEIAGNRVLAVAKPGRFTCPASASTSVEPAGGRRIRVRDGEKTAVLDVPPPTRTEVCGERYDTLPVFDKDKYDYARGVTLKGVRAWGVSTRFALDPSSVTVRSLDGRPFERGRDWLMQEDWGCIGRVADGTIGSNVAVTVDYAYSPLRIDSVFGTPDGIVIRSGAPDISLPKIREARAGERRLANIFVERSSDAIGDADIFIPEEGPLPIGRSETPEAASKCPKVWEKLQRGEPVKILAWGDSVTACDYLPNRERARWQEQFAARLRRRFPKSTITVVTEGWSGYDMKSFLETDVTHVHSFERKVLDVNPDLVISEFCNDEWMKTGDVEHYYGRTLGEFRRRGFEWIICTPHYVRPDWMGLPNQKNCDRDPRGLVSALRLFTGKHGLCLADASRRWGHLWREGVPYVSLLTNDINHPTAEGLKFFADALMELFGGDAEEAVVASPAFMMLRIGGAPEVDGAFLNEVWAGQWRSPGLFDEIWGSGCGTDPYAAVDTLVAEAVRINAPIAERCRELGIRFSYQQGMTLGHAPGPRPHPQVPDEAWAVDLDGRRMYGILCATSPFTWDFLRRKSEGIIRALQPASYWPDDDLRLDKHPPICFCTRCLGLFSERMSRTFTREELRAAVFGNPGDGRVRRAWTEFNAENVGRVAEAFRAARDAAKRDCRLGEQSAYSGQTYSGCYQRKVLEAFSGLSRDPVSMRAGAVYYMDRSPHELFAKQLDVAREAARCRRLGFVDQVCYEAEMWPHCGSMKAAGGEMMECAMALAAGCDSLAVYWGVSHNNEEAPEHCRYWVDTLIRWKPFLLAVRDVLEASDLAGGAFYHGSRFHDLPEWGEGLGWSEYRNHDDPAVVRLIENAVPMSVQEGNPDFHVLNERAVRTLSESDLPEVFARPVLIDVRAFRTFVLRFPGHELSAAVDVRNDGQEVVAGAGARPRELIGDKRSLDVHGAYVAKTKGVRAFSSISGTEKGMGTCLVRLSSGVGVVLIQDIAECFFPWSGYCRRAILDALDEAVPGGVPLRLLTDGYCVSVTARKDSAGRAVGALLLNASTGITPPLELSLRNRPDAAWMIRLPTADPICAKVVRRTDAETVIEIPELVPYQPILVYER